ncbi:DUF6212 domain-containing protein [Methylobacterium sp. sgz302541]|uniref:DUF6212 domain-containing protein n=1 Tax=unclassified Methylobacterium TaxID=2615210 RepID=UPI003D33B69A
MQGFHVLVAGVEPTARQSVPQAFRVSEVVALDAAGLHLLREGDGEPRATGLAPLPCLALFATPKTLPLMREARAWIAAQAAAPVPDVVLLDRKSPPAFVERTLLENLAAANAALAGSALRQARRVARLRAEVEMLGAVRAGLDRFVGETGLAQLKRVFSTATPDFETQIELVHGAPLRQVLPVAGTGFAAIDLACTGGKRRGSFVARLTLLEDGEVLAEWRVPTPAQDGWVRLGLPVAHAGLLRTLCLVVEPASEKSPCANLALGAHQPLPAAQLGDARTGLPIAPHSLAFRLYAAVPGTTPPHSADTLMPVAARKAKPVPYALQALPAEDLARVAETDPGTGGPNLLFVADVAAILCRPGAGGRIRAACPAGARGLMASVGVHADTPSAAVGVLGVDAGAAEPALQRVPVSSGGVEEVSLLFPEPLREARDILLSAEAVDGAAEGAWVVFRDLRIYT